MSKDWESSAISKVLQIAEGTAHQVGDEFHTALIDILHKVMNVSLAIITRGEGYPAHTAHTLYCWQEGKAAENFKYELEGTPCALVYGGKRITIPCDLGKRFPKEEGLEGYCGVPLLNRHQSVVGHFAVLSKEPFEDVELCETIMRIFGSRAEAELQRASSDGEREALVQSLRRSKGRLEQQREAARAANHFKSNLVEMTVHDLRNPLTAIISRAELISTYLKDKLPLERAKRIEKATQSADGIINTSERMETMIGEILDSSRSNATDLSYVPALFDLSITLATIVALNNEIAEKKSVQIVCDCPLTLDVLADEDRLIEAVDNLLNNAIKFSSSGSVVFLSAKQEDRCFKISVQDWGQGIVAEELNSIFDRFQDASAKPTGGETSFGLGLWIVKTIAERHGGDVLAKSDGEGQGACFTITIPNTI